MQDKVKIKLIKNNARETKVHLSSCGKQNRHNRRTRMTNSSRHIADNRKNKEVKKNINIPGEEISAKNKKHQSSKGYVVAAKWQ